MQASHSNRTEKSQASSGELFLVATPIGNLADITLRALEVLKIADAVACEDTRTSGVLLDHYGIKTRRIAYHEHNEAKASKALLEQLSAGKRIALISDAGTPLLSDPGARLVQQAISAGVRVTPIPGASALLAAATIAGLSLDHFYFAGFLPLKSAARKQVLARLQAIEATLILYEAPHRLEDTLTQLAEALGNRQAAVARELTKRHEECVRDRLIGLIAHFSAQPARGECVIIVEGRAQETGMDDTTLDALLTKLLRTYSLREAVTEAAAIAGRPKREVYARALKHKGSHDEAH